jgi:hypothetical protein
LLCALLCVLKGHEVHPAMIERCPTVHRAFADPYIAPLPFCLSLGVDQSFGFLDDGSTALVGVAQRENVVGCQLVLETVHGEV